MHMLKIKAENKNTLQVLYNSLLAFFQKTNIKCKKNSGSKNQNLDMMTS